MSLVGWIVVGVVAWMAVAVIVAVLIGRAIRIRDRQVPRPPTAESATRTESRPDRGDGP